MAHWGSSFSGPAWIRPLIAPTIAIGAALVVGALLILLAGANPLLAYRALFQEALFSYFGFGNTLTKLSPLLLAGLGVLVALRGGQFNIGAEGQIYMGGLGSTVVGLFLQGWPLWIHLPLTILAGFVFGAVWGWIPGYLKAQRGVNEVIVTLLLNYIAIHFIGYMVNDPLIAPGAPSPYSPLIAESARLPLIMPQTQAHGGVLLGLAAAGILFVLFNLTPWGYRVAAVASNPTAARYAGISVPGTIMMVMALSGGLAGLAGSAEVIGLKHRLFERFSPGYGFDAIAIAFLSRGSPLGVVITALFFSALRSGANVMQRSAGVPFTVIYAIQGLTVLFIAISLVIESRAQPQGSPRGAPVPAQTDPPIVVATSDE